MNNLKKCYTGQFVPEEVPPPVKNWKPRSPTPPRAREPETNEPATEGPSEPAAEVPEQSKRKRQVSFNMPKLPKLPGQKTKEKNDEPEGRMTTRSKGKAPEVEVPKRPLEWKKLKDFARKNKDK